MDNRKIRQYLLIMFFQTHWSPANGHLALHSKITMLWSRWSSKAEGRLWDTSPDRPWFDRMNLDLGFQIKHVNTSQQVVDILTEASFSRERWSQLTRLLNLKTPHMHTHSHLSASFFVLDTKAIRCLSVTVEQGPAHNLCASDLRSVRPSSSSINPWRNTAGRDPEQDANSVHSTKHVQKTQL